MTTPPVPSAESIEALRQALRALVQEVCDHLKGVETPVREWTRVLHVERVPIPVSEQRVDISGLVSRNALGNLPTFRRIFQLIQQDPALAGNLLTYLGGVPIDSTEYRYSWLKEMFIGPFLQRYFNQSQKLALVEGEFSDLFDLICSEMQNPTVPVKLIFPLINLRIPAEVIELENGIRLRDIPRDELEMWINDPFTLPIDRDRLLKVHCAIELDSEERNPFNLIYSDILGKETTDRVLGILRLLTNTDIFIEFSEGRYEKMLWRHSQGMSSVPSHRRDLPPCVLDENGAKQLKTLWKSLVDGQNRDRVQLPLKRFGDTAERMSAEDKLIDYWIALESLFAPESSSEIRYRAALRIASFLGEGEERTKIYRDVGLSYDFRSAVVHANRRRLANLGKKVTLADITERTRGYLRQVLLKILESDEVFDPQKIEHELLSG